MRRDQPVDEAEPDALLVDELPDDELPDGPPVELPDGPPVDPPVDPPGVAFGSTPQITVGLGLYFVV